MVVENVVVQGKGGNEIFTLYIILHCFDFGTTYVTPYIYIYKTYSKIKIES